MRWPDPIQVGIDVSQARSLRSKEGDQADSEINTVGHPQLPDMRIDGEEVLYISKGVQHSILESMSIGKLVHPGWMIDYKRSQTPLARIIHQFLLFGGEVNL